MILTIEGTKRPLLSSPSMAIRHYNRGYNILTVTSKPYHCFSLASSLPENKEGQLMYACAAVSAGRNSCFKSEDAVDLRQ